MKGIKPNNLHGKSTGGPTIFQNLYIFFIRLKILLASPAFNVGLSRNIICPVMQKLCGIITFIQPVIFQYFICLLFFGATFLFICTTSVVLCVSHHNQLFRHRNKRCTPSAFKSFFHFLFGIFCCWHYQCNNVPRFIYILRVFPSLSSSRIKSCMKLFIQKFTLL